MAWRPPGAASNFNDVLAPGIPLWMMRPLKDWCLLWLDDCLVTYAVAFDSATRHPSPCSVAAQGGLGRLFEELGEDRFIHFLDFVVYVSLTEGQDWEGLPFAPVIAEDLERVLQQNGSEWKVGTRDGQAGLEKRVPAGVQEAADSAMTTTGSAGQLLSEAWHAAFGREPDTEDAYEKAIKAVEEVAIPVVEPKNKSATLGTIISVMRNQGNWALELADKNGDFFPDTILAMCETLWKSQPSRHGANGYRKPTQGEGEAAVLLAVPLTQWFHSGGIARR